MSHDRDQGKAPSATTRARRRFLASVAGAAGSAALLTLGSAMFATPTAAAPVARLRPPGALPEDHFAGACIRCGLCVRACPYHTLRLARLGDGIAAGTPYFVAREVACAMCEDIPCVAACPTNALDHALDDIAKARMGTAALMDHDRCLSVSGLRCEVCTRASPLTGIAITLETRYVDRAGGQAQFIPTVHPESCTGCGKCEASCVLAGAAAIRVAPRLNRRRHRCDHP